MTALLKIATILAIFMAVSAGKINFIYDTSYIEDINNVVLIKKSNTCVILVVDGQIKFVATEGDSPAELAKCGQLVYGKNLEVLRARFVPLSTQDVIEKLSILGSKRSTFLVYFSTDPPRPRPPPSQFPAPYPGQVFPPIQNGFPQQGGLQALAQRALGLQIQDEGLLKIVLSFHGYNTQINSIQTIDF